MDVNQLLHNHQLAKLNAQHVLSRRDCDDNTDLVGQYAAQIIAWRKDEGLSAAGWPSDRAAATVQSR